MANRLKDDEKNEKIIRGLLKHPANKRCINCNSLGPQYVCTNFWTFICTNCSGLHREFTHRVKSISMAKFTSQEVNALQEGGNERAREIFFKEWDPQRHSYPDSSHLDRLRDFIKHVYVDRKYAGGKNIDASQRVKGEYDYDENRRSNTVGNGSRSPPYNESYEHRYGERPGSAGMNDDRSSRSSYEARSPTSDLGDYRSPSRFEMRDEMRQDNKVGNEVQSPKFCENRVSAGLSKQGVSDNKKGVYISSPPMVRPIREILGGDAPPLRVSDLPLKTNGGKSPNSPQGSTTSSKGSNDGNSVELKGGNLGSLIDFSADPEPPVAGEAQETFPQPSATTPAKNGGWAFFDVSSQQKAPEAASTVGDLESVFAQLSIPAATPVVNSSLSPASSLDSFPMGNNSGQWPAVQQQPSSFPTTSNMSAIRPINVPVGSLPIQGSVAVLDGQTALPVVHSSHRPAAVGYSQNPSESKANGRKELPVDLFSGLNPAPFASHPGWRMGPGHNLVYNMQNPVMMQPTSTFYNPPASMNPFDLANDSSPAANHMLHPSVSLQGALPNSYPLSLPKSSNLSTVPSQWAPQQFSYPLSASAGPYMVQQSSHGHQPPGSSFPALNQGVVSASDQLLPGTNPLQGSLHTSLPSSISGNPFG